MKFQTVLLLLVTATAMLEYCCATPADFGNSEHGHELEHRHGRGGHELERRRTRGRGTGGDDEDDEDNDDDNEEEEEEFGQLIKEEITYTSLVPRLFS